VVGVTPIDERSDVAEIAVAKILTIARICALFSANLFLMVTL
jgi:hypothetical protein